MKILIVEDDSYKRDDIISASFSKDIVSSVESVKDAVIAVERGPFDLVILDMALPTFSKKPKSGGGTTQASGGVEVLRALKHAGVKYKTIIVSQYPDLEIDRKYVSLTRAPSVLESKYKIPILGAIQYDYDSRDWVAPLDKLIKGIKP